MSKHLRIVRGNLVGPDGRVFKQGDRVFLSGKLITDVRERFIRAWTQETVFPSGEVQQKVFVKDDRNAAMEDTFYFGFSGEYISEVFGSRADAITSIEIANGAEVRIGERVWVMVPSYKGLVEKQVVNYTSESVILCYPDAYDKVRNNLQGKGCFVTSHKPGNVFASKEEAIKSHDLCQLSSAPLRAVHKVIKRP